MIPKQDYNYAMSRLKEIGLDGLQVEIVSESSTGMTTQQRLFVGNTDITHYASTVLGYRMGKQGLVVYGDNPLKAMNELKRIINNSI